MQGKDVSLWRISNPFCGLMSDEFIARFDQGWLGEPLGDRAR
jgi:hypothetical protein